MTYELLHGDCLESMRAMPDNSVDSIVTDPPYGLSFMGKRWDYDVPGVDVWAECLRVLKPGGHLLAFAGTRTQHRMAVRIEDAGFEIRDMIAWVYGCLDEATEVATENGVMPYHKTKIGDRVLCYDVENGEYTYQPILEIVEYDYSDTAFRLVGDFGEQVVSRNHRVIVERGGSEAFQLAETLECEARVPVLESLPALRQAIHDAHQGAGRPQQDVQFGLCEVVDRCGECCADTAGATQGCDDQVRGLRDERVEAGCVAAQGGDTDMQQEVQRRAARCGVGEACTQRSGALVGPVGDGAEGAHDGRVQPSMEGRFDISQPEGSLRRSADQVRAMPCGSDEHGSGGRLCHGAPSCGGAGSWETADASGVRASHQPRCDGQSEGEPDAVRHERTAQGIRAWGGHRSAVVRVVPFHYTGKVWCLRVPTGAFVAVRNGVAFPTGNSGFPKSHNGPWGGTALKPALEPITVARKPLIGTVAANWSEHGTGALNIDGCRVAGADKPVPFGNPTQAEGWRLNKRETDWQPSAIGRWPANLIHDGSDEVLDAFPNAPPGQLADASTNADARKTQNTYGAMRRGRGDEASANSKNAGAVGFKMKPGARRLDSGSAARFFYCAKASKKDRSEGCDRIEWRTGSELTGRKEGSIGLVGDSDNKGQTANPYANGAPVSRNHHPTVKPTDLMRYLCRLVTPAGGVVLDPFMGSGSTGKGAMLEGFRFIGCELSAEYMAIAEVRIGNTLERAQAARAAAESPAPQRDLFEGVSA